MAPPLEDGGAGVGTAVSGGGGSALRMPGGTSPLSPPRAPAVVTPLLAAPGSDGDVSAGGPAGMRVPTGAASCRTQPPNPSSRTVAGGRGARGVDSPVEAALGVAAVRVAQNAPYACRKVASGAATSFVTEPSSSCGEVGSRRAAQRSPDGGRGAACMHPMGWHASGWISCELGVGSHLVAQLGRPPFQLFGRGGHLCTESLELRALGLELGCARRHLGTWAWAWCMGMGMGMVRGDGHTRVQGTCAGHAHVPRARGMRMCHVRVELECSGLTLRRATSAWRFSAGLAEASSRATCQRAWCMCMVHGTWCMVHVHAHGLAEASRRATSSAASDSLHGACAWCMVHGACACAWCHLLGGIGQLPLRRLDRLDQPLARRLELPVLDHRGEVRSPAASEGVERGGQRLHCPLARHASLEVHRRGKRHRADGCSSGRVV